MVSMGEPTRSRSIGTVAANAVVTTADRARLLALRLQGARSIFVGRRGRRIHLVDIPGDGGLPPIVMLHGLSACGADYAPLFSRLRSATCRIVAPDLPGHGQSSAPSDLDTVHDLLGAVAHAVDAVVDAPAIVFGNSLGGLAAIRYALMHPHRTAGLFLVSPAGATSTARQLGALLDALRVDRHADAEAFVRRVLPTAGSSRAKRAGGLMDGWTTSLLAVGVRARLGRPAVRTMIERGRIETLLEPSELAGLRMPIRMVWGAQDRLLPPAHRDFFIRHLPRHASIETPASFGHAPFLDHPDEVAELIRRFAVDVAIRRGALPLRAPVRPFPADAAVAVG
jgi:pimeloyl-ACP methyl ester carboxylesterase